MSVLIVLVLLMLKLVVEERVHLLQEALVDQLMMEQVELVAMVEIKMVPAVPVAEELVVIPALAVMDQMVEVLVVQEALVVMVLEAAWARDWVVAVARSPAKGSETDLVVEVARDGKRRW